MPWFLGICRSPTRNDYDGQIDLETLDAPWSRRSFCGCSARIRCAEHFLCQGSGLHGRVLQERTGRVTDTCIGHIFERICKFNGIEKRHTKPYHPWTNGMVERMNRTIKESTIKAYEYEGLEQLRKHVQAFVQSYNFGKHLKALRWKTPFRAMCEAWEKDPSRFRLHPHHLTVGLNILMRRCTASCSWSCNVFSCHLLFPLITPHPLLFFHYFFLLIPSMP